jgi:transcription elongation factor Elf1
MKDRHLDEEASNLKSLRKTETAETFWCFRCGEEKKSKSRAEWKTIEGTKTICNGCYAELLLISRLASSSS